MVRNKAMPTLLSSSKKAEQNTNRSEERSGPSRNNDSYHTSGITVSSMRAIERRDVNGTVVN